MRVSILCPVSVGMLVTALAGQTWVQRHDGKGAVPKAHVAGAMVYDATCKKTVLFGGKDVFGNPLGETWTWNGTIWTKVAGKGPPPRLAAAMVYDSRRGVVVLFGGQDPTKKPPRLNDTWEWNGTWTDRTPASGNPTGRSGHGMAFHHNRGVTVMFGGNDGTRALDDTWTWNGTTWTIQPKRPQNPAARHDISEAMTYDRSRDRVVLHGGNNLGKVPNFQDTWEWNGTWAKSQDGPERTHHAIVYDPFLECVILYGGTKPNTLAFEDTWQRTGTTWTRRCVKCAPELRSSFVMAFDSHRRCVVLFAGRPTGVLDTWELCHYATFGSACGPTPQAKLSALSTPQLGTTFTVSVAPLPQKPPVMIGILGFSNQAWGAIRLPLALDALGMIGCKLYVSVFSLAGIFFTPPKANWALPIPNDRALLRIEFFQQGLVFKEGANAADLVVTDAGAGIIGL